MKDATKAKYSAYPSGSRVRYFHGMLLGDQDFRDEQIYHLEKRKLLNRKLHGWGIVCGLEIDKSEAATLKKTFTILPGLALDCMGNEIYVCKKVTLNIDDLLCVRSAQSNQTPCLPATNAPEHNYYLTISFDEQEGDLVPVYAPGGGCEQKACEPSRMREGFCVELLPDKPTPPAYPKLVTATTNDNNTISITQPTLACSSCCTEKNRLILGVLTIREDSQNKEKIITARTGETERTYAFSWSMVLSLVNSVSLDLKTNFASHETKIAALEKEIAELKKSKS